MKKSVIITTLVIIVVAGGAFFAGMKYQQSKQSNFLRQSGRVQGLRMGSGQFQGNRTGFRPVSGEIIESDDKSITVKLQDGSSKIILLSDKTEINKAASGTKDDLKAGERVAVFGQENSDGSVTAQSIQLNSVFGNMITPPPTN